MVMDRIVAGNSEAVEVGDLLSRLPDCVLGSIVSLVGTKEGARTAVLARRWRHVWRSAPLNLDDTVYKLLFEDGRLQIISEIVAAHRGPARRFAFRSLPLRRNTAHYDAWFRMPLFSALQELVLHSPIVPGQHELPASVLRLTSLRVLDIVNCVFPTGCSPAFPCLTHLALQQVHIKEEVIQSMVHNSPGIEALILDTNSGHRHLRLSLPRMRYLALFVRLFHRREDGDHRCHQ